MFSNIQRTMSLYVLTKPVRITLVLVTMFNLTMQYPKSWARSERSAISAETNKIRKNLKLLNEFKRSYLEKKRPINSQIIRIGEELRKDDLPAKRRKALKDELMRLIEEWINAFRDFALNSMAIMDQIDKQLSIMMMEISKLHDASQGFDSQNQTSKDKQISDWLSDIAQFEKEFFERYMQSDPELRALIDDTNYKRLMKARRSMSTAYQDLPKNKKTYQRSYKGILSSLENLKNKVKVHKYAIDRSKQSLDTIHSEIHSSRQIELLGYAVPMQKLIKYMIGLCIGSIFFLALYLWKRLIL